MKYTSLFSAVAIAAAMGTQALATVTTNDVGTVQTFEGEGALADRTGWTVLSEDQSEIIAAPLSSQDAVEGYTANQHLKLNTEGQELVYNPGTVSQPKSIIEMKVRLVASDTAPAISAEDTTVHAAVYLQVSEPADADNDGLYAYTATGWDKLAAPFNAQLQTGSMIALRVLMDYTARTATYEGCVLADAENDVPTYVNLGTKAMANPTSATTQGHLSTIAFKGTGGVDDLFVGQITETASTASLTIELWTDLDAAQPEEGPYSSTVDTVDASKKGTASFETDLTGETLTYKLYDVTSGEECTWLVTPTVDADGNFEVSKDNYGFEVDHTYRIQIIVGDVPQPATYTGPKSNGIQILAAADKDAYEAATGETFVPLAFTSISVNGNVVTAAFNATVVNEGNETTATFAVAYKNSLDGAEQTANGTVTLTTGGGTVTVTLPEGDAHFITGISAPASVAGE